MEGGSGLGVPRLSGQCLENSSSAGPNEARYKSTPRMPAVWNSPTRLRTAPATSGSTPSQYCVSASLGLVARGRQAGKMVLLAAALSLICKLPSDSVFIGQLAVMVNPA